MIFYIIISVLTAWFLILGVLAIGKKRRTRIIADVNDPDMDLNIKNLAIRMSVVSKYGSGIPVYSLTVRMRRAFRVVRRKVREGVELAGCERVLYENYNTLSVFFRSNRWRELNSLPKCEGRIRALALADLIVSLSKCEPDRERIVSDIKLFNEYSPLYNDEVTMLPLCFEYALIRHICEICDKIVRFDKARRYAIKDKKVIAEHAVLPGYLYYFKTSGKSVSDDELDKKCDLGIDGAESAYTSLLIDCNIIISSAVATVRKIADIFDTDTMTEVSPVCAIMNCDEIFRNMDHESRLLYAKAVSSLSTMLNVSERAVTDAAFAIAKEYGLHFGEVLLDKPTRIRKYLKGGKWKEHSAIGHRTGVYISLVFLVSVLISGAFALIVPSPVYSVLVFLLSVTAFMTTARYFVDRVFDYFLPHRSVPRLNYDVIPDEGAVAVVVSELLSDKNDALRAVQNVIALRNCNQGKNVSFILLADLTPCKDLSRAEDTEILNVLKSKDCYPDVHFLVRGRVKQGGVMRGRERKRGAIEDLNKLLISSDKQSFIYISSIPVKPEFVMLLDSDSKIEPGAVKRAVNAMLHPLAAKYDLLTFSSRYSVGSVNTLYSRKYLIASGVENYCNYSDFYYDLCGRSVFCGKGIYRLNSYSSAVSGAFPEGKVLSHDIVEGSFVRCGSLRQNVYEDAPSTFSADAARLKRWQRGDLLLLPYITDKRVTHPLYRFVMATNALQVIAPLMTLSLVLTALCSGIWQIYLSAAFALFAIPLTDAGYILFNLRGNRIRYVLQDLVSCIVSAVANAALLPYYAFSGLFICVKTLLMSIAGKDMLEWTTFRSAQNSNKLVKHLKTVLPSCIAACILAGALYAYMYAVIYLAIYVTFAFGMYVTNYRTCTSKAMDKDDRVFLKSVATDTYEYFLRAQNAGMLITDNISSACMDKISDMTSPTNIGMGMLAHVCAAKLGIISDDVAVDRIENDLRKVSSLEKWNGHLYNWYAIEDGRVLAPQFVSSVDSGNFIACLICVSEYLKSTGRSNANALSLIQNCNMDALYDSKTGKFCIGYNASAGKYEGSYDLLASESRTLTYIAACMKGKAEMWYNMRRDVVSLRGNMLVSWGGTAFEYLMPQLFMSDVEYGIVTKSCRALCNIMKRCKRHGVFGISESGYCSYDDKGNYRYNQFGLSGVALKAEDSRSVISPYSSALALRYIPRAAIKNLKKLKKRGVYGNYGFYEAVDYTAGGEVVYSHMSHHQGMILAAITNALCDDAIISLFGTSEIVAGGEVMKGELLPHIRCTRRHKCDCVYDVKDICFSCEYTENVRNSMSVALLSDGNYGIAADARGCGVSTYSGIRINKYYDKRHMCSGAYFYISDGETVYSPTYAPLFENKYDYSFSHTPRKITFENKTKRCLQQVFLPVGGDGEIRKLVINNDTESVRTYKIAYYERLSLCTPGEAAAHPAYNEMFISANTDDSGIYAVKKSRHKDGDIWLGFRVTGINNVKYECNAMNFAQRCNILPDPASIFTQKDLKYPSSGDVLTPCIGFEGEVTLLAGESKNIWTIKVLRDSEKAMCDALFTANDKEYFRYEEKACAVPTTRITRYRHSQSVNAIINEAASVMMYNHADAENISKLSDRVRKLIFPDGHADKMMLVDYDASPPGVEEWICAALYLNLSGISCKLAVTCKGNDTYFNDKRNKILRGLRVGNIENLNIVRVYDTDDHELVNGLISVALCHSGIEYDRKPDADREETYSGNEEYLPALFKSVNMPPCVYECGNGYFTDGYDYIVTSLPMLPYSNVICMDKGGFVITENGGGFTYLENSCENKITNWYNDPVSDMPSERLYIVRDNRFARINKLNEFGYVRHGRGFTEFCGSAQDIEYKVCVYPVKNGEAKIYELTLLCDSQDCNVRCMFNADIALGRWEMPGDLYAEMMRSNTLCVRNAFNGKEVYLRCSLDSKCITKEKHAYVCDKCEFTSMDPDTVKSAAGRAANGYAACIFTDVQLKQGKPQRFYFSVCGCRKTAAEMSFSDIEEYKNKSLRMFADMSRITVNSKVPENDILFNEWLPYQIRSSRINGRCGYWQAGGAIGFRDQLQDCLALMYSDRKYVGDMIMDCASHQYEEGDVMHWWHPPAFGVRTAITDDRLFLPYVTCAYIRHTGDKNILMKTARYIKSVPLKKGEEARLEVPQSSAIREELLYHLQRAVDSVMNFGEHGLLLIGGGDWNDALNGIGLEGRGESVWLSMFAYRVLADLTPFTDGDVRVKYVQLMDRLKEGIDSAFYDGRFARAFTDWGDWLGTESSNVCRLDLITQAWAVISAVDIQRGREAVEKVLSLIDTDTGVIKLLDPPFDKNKYYGYISAYPEGVRENGGQYTHGAVWLLKAVCMTGNGTLAQKLIEMLNPVFKTNGDNNAVYKGEPYVLAADVYSNKYNNGRAGWSWYTGSAAWFYKVYLEDYLGFKVINNEIICTKPLSESWQGMQITYRYKDCVFRISYEKGDSDAVIENGVTITGGGIYLERKPGLYEITLTFADNSVE